MQNKRRPSVRTRLRPEDVTCWVEHNQGHPIIESSHVRFEDRNNKLDDDDSIADTESLTEEPRYTDGGYGWVIVFFSYLMHFILDGTSFSFGVIFPKIQSKYKSERTGASLAASLFLSFPLIFAPLAGAITDVFECKKTILLGATMCFISSILSIFCPDIYSFSIIFGAGAGIGLALMYNAAIVIVTYWFNKRRGLATAFAVTGTGTGTFCFPFYLNFFVSMLHGRVSELNAQIIALIFAFGVCIIIGIVIKDVEWYSDTDEFKKRKFEHDVRKMLDEQETLAASKNEKPFRRAISLPHIPLSSIFRRLGETQSVQSIRDACVDEQPTRSKSVGIFLRRDTLPTVPEYSLLTTGLEHLEHLDLHLSNSPCTTVKSNRKRMLTMSVDRINEYENDEEDLRLNLHSRSTQSTQNRDQSSLIVLEMNEEDEDDSSSDSEVSNDGDSSSSEISEHVEKSIVSPKDNAVIRKTIGTNGITSVPTSARFARASLATGTTGMNAGRIIASNAIQPRSSRIPANSNLITMGKIPSAPQLAARKKRRTFFSRKKHASINYISNELEGYKNLFVLASFSYMLGSSFCLYLVLDVPYVYFFDHSVTNLGIDETRSAWLTSMIGASNVIATNCFGVLSDHEYFKDHILFIYAFILLGVAISMFAAAVVSSHWAMMAVACLFGVSVSVNYVLQSILLTILFDDISVFQGTYALTSLVEGLACFVGPLIIGFVRDSMGSYTMVFYCAGVIATLSAFLAFKSAQHHLLELAAEEELERQESTKSTEKRVHKKCKKHFRENVQTKGTLFVLQNSTISKIWKTLSGNSSRAIQNGNDGTPEAVNLLGKV